MADAISAPAPTTDSNLPETPALDKPPTVESVVTEQKTDASAPATESSEPQVTSAPATQPDAETQSSTENATKEPSRATSPQPPNSTSRAASQSSNSSRAKENGTPNADPAPVYGTRSRKSGARVNYADDDYEFELAVAKAEESSKGANFGDASHARPTTEGTRAAQTIRLSTAAPNGASSASGSGNEKNTSPASSQPPERKKRKYTRHDQKAAPSPDARIPGTSQFFASPSAPDQPASKKRKTGDSLPQNGESMATTRKQAAHPTSAKAEGRTAQIVTFAKHGAQLRNGKLYADDGDVYSVGDTVYLICEPPGDPYYLCRIMEFRRDDPEDLQSPATSMLVNWFYRPKDIGRYSADARYLFGSMQSDESPITSLRGKCIITHKSEISNVEEYRKQPDSFWFNQLYDRYIMRPYEIIPTTSVINVPEKVKKVLDEKWKYLVVEPARLKELTAAIKLCKRCQTYCAPSNSVDCGVCHNTYHMACVRPALTKKPSRGFAWSCGPCSRAQERRLEQRSNGTIPEEAEDEHMEEDDEEAKALTTAPSPQDAEMADAPANELDTAHADLWPWRYLGIHCKVEDVLQYDDRAIYPRASSRLGPRHQANVILWPGRPVELVKTAEIRKKYGKAATAKVPPKPVKDSQAATDSDAVKATRPRWVQDAPQGYVARGEDAENGDKGCTATRLFVLPQSDTQETSASNGQSPSADTLTDEYMAEVDRLADSWGQVKPFERVVNHERTSIRQISSNYLDQALKLFQKHKFDKTAALAELKSKHSPKDLGNPEFSKEELKKFEDGIIKHGTDFRMVRKGVKGRSTGEIVRFYYGWKSTPRGREVRDRHEGRRGAKKGRAESSWTEIADEEDDSAFDSGRAEKHKRHFQCKFCLTQHSRQWRRAPNVSPGAITLLDPKGSNKDKSNQLVVALCNRCAIMWRKYGMRFEEPDEIAKSISQLGGRAWKRKVDEELLREIVYANEAARVATPPLAAQAAAAIGLTVTVPWDPPKKKVKSIEGKEGAAMPGTAKNKAPVAPPREPTPPIVPQEAKLRDLPCAVCRHGGVGDDEKIYCKDCRLTVHRRCYAVPEDANSDSWVCDTCANDRNPLVSLEYTCCLCNTGEHPIELIEQPKVSHKKKSERDREKDNLERDLRLKLLDKYIKEQRAKGKPIHPRDALKKTAQNNWMHITCAVFTPEIKFADFMAMDGIEGLGAVASNPARADHDCKICNVKKSGFCVSCFQCHKPFHVSCAHDADYLMGFDVAPVKGSRKDVIQTVTFQAETGLLTAAIWCKDHQPKTMVHDMTEPTEDGIIALQAFVRKYKAADLTLTGTARKANLLGQSTKAVTSTPGRRTSLLTNGVAPKGANGTFLDDHYDGRKCVECGADSTVKWHAQNHHAPGMTNGFVAEATTFKCHKCHMRIIKGEEPAPPTKPIEELVGPVPQPDYFGQTSSAPRPPVNAEAVTWGAGHPVTIGGLSGTGGMQVSPESWARGLFETTITLVNPHKGGQHVFHGRDFNLQLDGDPTPGFRYLQHYAATDCNYDPMQYTILTDEGQVIDTPGRFTATLAALLIQRPGPKNIQWRLIDSRELLYPPGPHTFPTPLGAMHPAPPATHSHLPPPPPPSGTIPRAGAPYQAPPRTPPGGFFPPAQGYKYGHAAPAPGMAPPPAMAPAPAYIRAASAHEGGPSAVQHGPGPTAQGAGAHQSPHRSNAIPVERNGGPAAFAGSPPAGRATTPREMPPGVAIGGASSSPSLRNLMH